MKTIEVPVSDAEHDAFRAVAAREQRPLSELAHEALVSFLEAPRMKTSHSRFELPVFPEPEQVAPLPSREELNDEMVDRGRGRR